MTYLQSFYRETPASAANRHSNYLFIIETPSGNRHLIPVADEFVTGVDMDGRRVPMELPEGVKFHNLYQSTA